MKFSLFPLLSLVTSAAIAAPVPIANAEASPGYGKYSGYGSYPPPPGGYGKYSGYGTYKRAEDGVEKRDVAHYDSYDAPAGGVSIPSYTLGESKVDMILIVWRLWKLFQRARP